MNTTYNSAIILSVNANGRPMRTYSHQGMFFIESREDTEYTIEIKNNNWFRVEAVVSVDGLSVITGNPASKADSGYIVNGNDKLVIKGFRKSNDEVGAFKFTKKERSYAAEKGDKSNVGVIAVAIHREKPTFNVLNSIVGQYHAYSNTAGPVPRPDPFPTTDSLQWTTDSNTSGLLRSVNTSTTYSVQNSVGLEPQAQATATFSHGTTWGSKIQDKVVHVEFQRDGIIMEQSIYYNSKENLEAMGIKIVREVQINLPQGFPVDYATPPKNWQG